MMILQVLKAKFTIQVEVLVKNSNKYESRTVRNLNDVSFIKGQERAYPDQSFYQHFP